ncbi:MULTISPECIES: MarR family winged helix-turn-helix transcriptional regulator [Streptacidiphilus]|uniref:MarR family winged helix-turn-helix transcriptional regulator n=2 Tax=Streptacidiphilus TaxID=228398 RepID=A0ABV6UPS0_9ACTN|nr:MarR family transcriptional regulator [Streptacidiphilus jeojiense]
MNTKPRPQQPTPSAATAQRLQDAMTRLRARLRAESGQNATGLTLSQLGILSGVVREGPVTAARLAALEHVSAQAVTQSLAVLKEAGLVHSEPDPLDGRKKLVSADTSATELIDRILAGRASFLARAIDQVVAPEERQDLARAIELLERLAEADLSGGGI